MKNKSIRDKIIRCGLRHWQVAEEIGVSEQTLCRWLRTPLTDERQAAVESAIQKLEGGEYDEK